MGRIMADGGEEVFMGKGGMVDRHNVDVVADQTKAEQSAACRQRGGMMSSPMRPKPLIPTVGAEERGSVVMGTARC
jgi:hypothetical protein